MVDEDTKVPPTTIGSTSSSSHPPCLPPPRFPKRLALIELNSLNFEQGFDEQLGDGCIQSHLLCSIWRGLPSRPATLDGCENLVCERWINQLFMICSTPQASLPTGKAEPCPTCMKGFRIGEILIWPAWQRWAQLAFNAQIMQCPNGCAFSAFSTPTQTEEHHARVCPRRVIACSIDWCHMIGPTVLIEDQQYITCPVMRLHCLTCNLPLRAKKLATLD